jgi:hypothetical protein
MRRTKTKVGPLFLSIFLIGLFLPLISFADGSYQIKIGQSTCTVSYKGLVPCGKCEEISGCSIDLNSLPEGLRSFSSEYCQTASSGNVSKIYIPCQFCHFFVMINGIFKFVLINIVPPLAVLMLVAGGIMFYFAGGNPKLLTQGKSLIKAVIIGLFLVYGSYMIVGFLLTALGAADVSPIKDIFQNGVFTINCPIEL